MKRIYLLSLVVILFYGAPAQTVPNYVPTDSLEAWYPFNGNANNAYGTGKNGSVLGPALTVDRFGNPNSAYHFDGINSHITIDTAFFNVGWSNFSVSLWEKDDTLNDPADAGNSQMVFNTVPHNGIALTLNWHSSNHYMFFANSNPSLIYTWNILDQDTSIATLGTHVWNHMVFVKKNDTAYSFYLNGALDRTFTGATTAINYYTRLIFGRIDTAYPAEAFWGSLDDYGIWNRALASCEIKRLYHASPYTYITSQPSNDTAAAGSITHLTEVDTGTGNTYQWQVNAGSGFTNLTGTTPYSGVTTPTLTITGVTSAMSGYKYRCVVSGAQPCVDTSAAAVLTVRSLDVGQVSEQHVSFVPNPTNGVVRIYGIGDADIKVYNMLGQQIKEEKQAESVSLAEFPSGLYVVRVFNDDGLIVAWSKITKM